ncbi:hypothetical protein SUDANB121_04395 [Nocardiopsis dassonvillei]
MGNRFRGDRPGVLPTSVLLQANNSEVTTIDALPVGVLLLTSLTRFSNGLSLRP